MSAENIEVVRRIYEALARRDTTTIFALYDPEVEFYFARGTFQDRIGQADVYRGYAGLREIDRELRGAFENFETTSEDLIDAGERVVSVSRYRARGRSVSRYRARGRGSGVEVDGPLQFGLWTIRNHRVVRVDWFDTREQAIAAAGLSE